jgi:DNA-binding response OmpR family regulator
MRATHSDLLSNSAPSRPRNFSTVPIMDVPAADGGADRPVVLVVNKEPDIADAVSEILSHHGYAAITAYDGEDALETALLIPPQLVIADIGLPGISGIEVATVLKKELPDCKVLLLYGQQDHSDKLASAKSAGHKFQLVGKPVHPIDLLAHVSASLKPS